jgi:putative membrane protein
MRFLRLLFWLFLALLAALFMGRNWTDVTVDLWGNVQADIKLPLILLIAFLFGYVPTTLRWRLRFWRLRKEVEAAPSTVAPPPPPFAGETQP